MSKQDRQGVRTINGLEQKYQFGREFAKQDQAISKQGQAISSQNMTLSQFISFTTAAISDLTASTVKKAGDTISGVLDMSGNKITSVANPTNNTDAANKTYVDGKSPLVKLSNICSDYGYTVFPLCKISTTANTHLESGTQGIFYFKRKNGLQAPKMLMVQADNKYAEANMFNIATIGEIPYNTSMTASTGNGFRTCRFQMDGVWYGGIAVCIGNANHDNVSFVGITNSNTVKGIDIYKRNTSTVLNEEIYNSIVYDAGIFADDLYRNTAKMGLQAYPVNSIYISYSQTSPASLFGGTWTRISGYFLWAVSNTDASAIGVTGGERTHTLTVDEMPSHTHFNKLNGGSQTEASSVYDWISNSKAWQWYNIATDKTGGDQAHNNMPPYIQVAVWRRTA